MYRIRLAVTAIVVVAIGTSANAQLVPHPPELGPNDPYRIIFVTTTKIAPAYSSSPTMYIYNDFVTDDAQGNATLWALTEEWYVVGSDSGIDARDNTGTNPSELFQVPIYNTRGERIADDYVDLWDGTIDNPVFYDRDGYEPDGYLGVYTGTGPYGTGEATFTLNAPAGIRLGIRTYADNWWIYSPEIIARPVSDQRLYAMSGIIPEPATLSLIVLGGLILLRRIR